MINKPIPENFNPAVIGLRDFVFVGICETDYVSAVFSVSVKRRL